MKFTSWTNRSLYLIKCRYFYICYNRGGAFMGRCGGGWSYKFGIMGSLTELVIELTFITVRVSLKGRLK